MPIVAPGLVKSSPAVAVGICEATPLDASRDNFRQTKIENFGVTQFGHENVCWLDVSVDDSLSVGCSECIGNLNRQFQHLVQRKRFARNSVLQRFAVEKLHRNELLAVSLADVVDGADVRVI